MISFKHKLKKYNKLTSTFTSTVFDGSAALEDSTLVALATSGLEDGSATALLDSGLDEDSGLDSLMRASGVAARRAVGLKATAVADPSSDLTKY